MQYTYIWKVIPSTQPTVIRSCQKCGNSAEFVSSGNFRVNANQNKIDVWLIYQCIKCKSTWNMEILSRTKINAIQKDLYLKFLQNDQDLAYHYAFDTAIHNRNRTNLNYNGVDYEILGDTVDLTCMQNDIQIKFCSAYPIDLRLDKLLSKQLGLSRETIRAMSKSGKITQTDGNEISKVKIIDGLCICIKR